MALVAWLALLCVFLHGIWHLASYEAHDWRRFDAQTCLTLATGYKKPRRWSCFMVLAYASVSIASFAEEREEKILYSSTIPESFQEEGAPVIRYQGAFSYVGIER